MTRMQSEFSFRSVECGGLVSALHLGEETPRERRECVKILLVRERARILLYRVAQSKLGLLERFTKFVDPVVQGFLGMYVILCRGARPWVDPGLSYISQGWAPPQVASVFGQSDRSKWDWLVL